MKKISIYLFVLLLFACVDNKKNHNSIFKDKNLEIAVREALNYNEGQKITIRDLDSIKKISCLYCKDLTGIKNLRNLNEIVFSKSNVKDFSELKELKHLTSLAIIYSKFDNINFIHELTTLKYLYFDDNKTIINLENLNSLSNLENLCLLNSKISDITAIGSLHKLKVLWIYHNKIKDISVISKLENLEEIIAYDNRIQNMPNLSRCQRLRKIDLAYNNLIFNENFYYLNNIGILELSHNHIDDISWVTSLKYPNYINLAINPINCDKIKNSKILVDLIKSNHLFIDCK